MNNDSDDTNRTEYRGWSLLGSTTGENRSENAAERKTEFSDDDEDWGPPPTMREPLFRDRIRERLGVTPHQWYIIESVLIAVPYPLFLAVYISFSVNDMLFLGVTLVYSLFAMYVGFIS